MLNLYEKGPGQGTRQEHIVAPAFGGSMTAGEEQAGLWEHPRGAPTQAWWYMPRIPILETLR